MLTLLICFKEFAAEKHCCLLTQGCSLEDLQLLEGVAPAWMGQEGKDIVGRIPDDLEPYLFRHLDIFFVWSKYVSK